METAEQSAPGTQHVVDVSDLDKIASPSIVKRLKEADIDKDGILNVQELIQLVQSEQRAHADRRLFRNFLIALMVAVLILVAALVGAVYGIVKLTDEVDDNNGVLVSANTGSVMSTGKATNLMDLSKLYSSSNRTGGVDGTTRSIPDVALAEQLEILVMPQPDGGYTVHHVASVWSFPGEQRAIVVSEDGSVIQVGTTGLMYLKNAVEDYLTTSSGDMGVNDSSPGRRLLNDGTQTGYGVRTASSAPGDASVPSSCTNQPSIRAYKECLAADYCGSGIKLFGNGQRPMPCTEFCNKKFCLDEPVGDYEYEYDDYDEYCDYDEHGGTSNCSVGSHG